VPLGKGVCGAANFFLAPPYFSQREVFASLLHFDHVITFKYRVPTGASAVIVVNFEIFVRRPYSEHNVTYTIHAFVSRVVSVA